jgi:membrane protease YdiL (CAAX protease family)
MSVVRRWPIATFALLVLALTAIVLVASLGRDATPFALVLVPAVSAILVAGAVGGRAAIGGLFARAARWRVPGRWYAAALGIPIAAAVLIDLAGIVAGQATAGEVIGAIGADALLVPLVVFLPALFEEVGWRGFGVETALQRGWSVVAAAIGIGLIFVAIHLPLYLPGHLYEDLPLWPAPLTLMGGAALLTWIYVGAGHSALLAGITHAALNGAVPLTWGLDPVWAWQARGVVVALIGLATLVILAQSRDVDDQAKAPGG